MNAQNYILPKILWLWIPIFAFAIKMAVELLLDFQTKMWMVSENGPYELMQFVIMAAALLYAVFILWQMDKSSWAITVWIAIAALGALYVAGEEISWGQHILQWSTPDNWAAINDQGETNLHNTSSWLDQKPRLLLTIGVYVGGLLIPLLLMLKPNTLPKKFEMIYPSKEFMIVAGICLIIKIMDKISDFSDLDILTRNAENEEMFLFYFVLLYLFLMKKRLIPAR